LLGHALVHRKADNLTAEQIDDDLLLKFSKVDRLDICTVRNSAVRGSRSGLEFASGDRIRQREC
jgi:hypothetical protein